MIRAAQRYPRRKRLSPHAPGPKKAIRFPFPYLIVMSDLPGEKA